MTLKHADLRSSKEKFVEELLLNLLEQGRKDSDVMPVLWVGAGLSKLAGYDTTTELIEKLREEFINLPAYTPDDTTAISAHMHQYSFSHWIDYCANELKLKDRLYRKIQELFRGVDAQVTDCHRNLLGLPWQDVITTNYDQLLESTLRELEIEHQIVVFERGYKYRDGSFCLYKVHGDINDPSNYVLGDDSYRKFSDKYPFLDTWFKYELATKSIIFIGCSMMDYRIIEQYKKYLNLKESDTSCTLYEDSSVVIIRRADWAALPNSYQELYAKVNVYPLFFEDFESLPLLVEEIVKVFNDTTGRRNHLDMQNELAEQERIIRENRDLTRIVIHELIPQLNECIYEICVGWQQREHWPDDEAAVYKNFYVKHKLGLLTIYLAKFVRKLGAGNEGFNTWYSIYEIVVEHFIANNINYAFMNKCNGSVAQLMGALKIYKEPNELANKDDNFKRAYYTVLQKCCEIVIECCNLLAVSIDGCVQDATSEAFERAIELCIKMIEKKMCTVDCNEWTDQCGDSQVKLYLGEVGQ